MNRRQFLAAASAASLATHLDKLAWATLAPNYTLLDIQRGPDRFQIDFSTAEGYKTAAWLLRDVRANRVGVPNIEMLQLAAWAQVVLAEHHAYTVFEVTSGLRTHHTNSIIEGAARHSRHLPDENGQFYAMDIKPFGVNIDQLAKILQYPAFGGVGVYRSHVHFDIRDHATQWRWKK
ncbi:MAG: D-Ala-D-Ala carboxypeptidase family metallohydrolase [Pseudomonadota bacterium]